MEEENQESEELAPRKQSLFPLTPDDIVDNALQNLSEKQAAAVTQKAADEIVRISIEKRKAEYRSSAAQEEMQHLIHNANLLDQRGGDYRINSSFETGTGTTNVEIQRSSTRTLIVILISLAAVILLAALLLLLFR